MTTKKQKPCTRGSIREAVELHGMQAGLKAVVKRYGDEARGPMRQWVQGIEKKAEREAARELFHSHFPPGHGGPARADALTVSAEGRVTLRMSPLADSGDLVDVVETTLDDGRRAYALAKSRKRPKAA